MELRVIEAQQASVVGDSRITVVRFDPGHWRLVFLGLSNTGEEHALTARQWCERHGLTAAINAGMFNSDHRTHTGYLCTKDHENNTRLNTYQSVAAFDPRRAGLPPFRIFDLDDPGTSIKTILQDYESVVQNLRLIKRPGKNRWSQQKKMWSEAALGEDESGRILFIFSRSPFTMHDFNNILLSSDIGVVAAQHLEGGPEAQLYLRADSVTLDLFGSYETDFYESDGNKQAWPIPNVLGIRPAEKEN